MIKTDNSSLPAKLNIRRYFLDKYATGEFTVIDCCAGYQEIWTVLRKEYPECNYCGIDKRKIEGVLHADSKRILSTGMVADVIDIDTYGSPWGHWHNLIPNIKNETIVFLTIGSTGMRNQSKQAMKIAGLQFSKLKLPGTLAGKFDNIINMRNIKAVEQYSYVIVNEAKIIESKNVKYIGLHLQSRAKYDIIKEKERGVPCQ